MNISRTFFPVAILSIFLITALTNNSSDYRGKKSKVVKYLASHIWQVEETYQNLSGKRTHYIRSGENTTGVNIGKMRLKFNPDGTGTHTDISGASFDMVWSFTSSDERSLRLKVNGTVIYDWLFTAISKDAILQTSITNANGLISAKWVAAK